MKLRFFLITLFSLLTMSVYAQQEEGGISGLLLTRTDRARIDDARATLVYPSGATTVTYTQRGRFEFKGLQPGTYKIRFEISGLQSVEITVLVEDSVKDIGIVTLASEYMAEDLDESDFALLDAEYSDAQDMPMILSASKDVFDNIAGFKFSQMRFRTRGYDSGLTDVYLNGIYFNDALTGYSPWSLWTGLNDVTRSQEVTSGAEISSYGVGGVGSSVNINARASQIRKGARVSFVNANNQYRFRVMATYGSGELDNGWSYAMSVSTRQGGNDWINGVYYNTWGYFGSVEKKFSIAHRIGFTFFGTPGQRSVQGAATQEVYDLVGSNMYNPNWGYVNGTNWKNMKSARVRDNHEPIAMLNYSFEPSSNLTVMAAVSYRFGRNGYTALDWYDAPDPRPDYYRYLPSYHLRENDYYDPEKAEQAKYGWETDWGIRQINWEKLYNVNYGSYFRDNDDTEYFNGVNPAGMRRSKYVIEERRTDQNDLNMKLQVMTTAGRFSKITAGITFRHNKTEYYKKLRDLLGGDYYLDVDQFAERDFLTGDAIQNNLLTPNRLVKKGDKYGYDYNAHIRRQTVWATYKLTLPQFELDLGGETGHTKYWREGLYQKGLFPENSLGNSEKLDFWTYSVKAGARYRITGNHLIYANFANLRNAPYFQDVFVSPRTRNDVQNSVKSEKITSVDLNYAVRMSKLRLRVSGFYTKIKDKMDVISFYDDLNQSFTNFAMSGIDQEHAGLELGASVPLFWRIQAEAAVSYGYYKYTSNPYVTQTVDNNSSVILENERVYWKDMKVSGTPQTAANVGLKYRGAKNFWAGIDVNYFDALYIGMNPLYRTDNAHQNLNYQESQAMAKQERFSHSFVVNANVSKSWFLKAGPVLNINFDVKNILNDKKIKTGGYEQMRLYKLTDESTKYVRFDSKYYYMMGATYYLNVSLRF